MIPDNPLGGASSLRETWRRQSFCPLGAHGPSYGLLPGSQTASQTVSPSSRVLMGYPG
jgi:hypothetical protein